MGTIAAEPELEAVEIRLLLEERVQHYGYDFRDYASTSIRRQIAAQADRGHKHHQGLQDGCCTSVPAWAHLLLALTVHVTSMFRDPSFLSRLSADGRAAAPDLPLRADPGTRDAPRARRSSRSPSSSRRKASTKNAGSTPPTCPKPSLAAPRKRVPLAAMKEYTENYQKAGGKTSFSEYYTARYDHALFKPSLRENVVFAPHNLVTEGSFNEFNVILCRNVMICFQQVVAGTSTACCIKVFPTSECSHSGRDRSASRRTRRPTRRSTGPNGSIGRWRDGVSVVVVGTSLGGLTAMRVLLSGLPAAFRPPVVVVQHRSKSADDALVKLLGKATPLAVRAQRRGYPDPGPSTSRSGRLSPVARARFLTLSTEAPVNHARPSIDVLFESAAATHGRGVVGVILTGSNGRAVPGVPRASRSAAASCWCRKPPAPRPPPCRLRSSLHQIDKIRAFVQAWLRLHRSVPGATENSAWVT